VPWALVLLWIAVNAAQYVLGGWAWVRPTAGSRRWAMLLAGIASLVSLITLVLFMRVFVVGRSSNVAQLAGEEGYALWSLWFRAWIWLYIGNPLSFITCVLSLAAKPWPLQDWRSWTSRVLASANAALAAYFTATYFPDA
jgi:hypothetical protein